MAVNAAVGSFNISGGATTEITVSGLPFQPKGVIFWWNGTTSAVDAVSAADFFRGMGFAAGSTQRGCATGFDDHGQGTTNSDKYITDAACIARLDASQNVTLSVDFDAFESDGFTVVVDSNAGSIQMQVNYFAFGGDEIAEVKVGKFAGDFTSSFSMSSVGFRPNCMMFLGVGNATIPQGPLTRDQLNFGVMTADGQGWLSGSQQNGTSASDTKAGAGVGRGFKLSAIGNLMMEFVQFLSNGVEFNYVNGSGNTNEILYMAVRGGKWAVDSDFTLDTLDQFSVNVGFEPVGAMIFSAMQSADTGDDADPDFDDAWSVGAMDGSGSRVSAIHSDDAADPTSNTLAVDYDAVYVNIAAGAVLGKAISQGFSATGIDLEMEDADPAPRFFWTLSLGSAQIPIEGILNGVSGSSAVNKRVRSIAGAMNSVSAFSASLKAIRNLAATLMAESTMLAEELEIAGKKSLVGSLDAVSTLSASLNSIYSQVGQLNAVSGASGIFNRAVALTGQLAASSVLSATFGTEPGTVTTFNVIKPRPIELEAVYG